MSVKQNLVIEQGTTFSQTSTLTDISGNLFNTANCVVAAQIRKTYFAANNVVMNATVNNAVIVLSLTANQTSQMWPGRYVYDCILTRGDGTIDRILEGIVTVTADVTR